MFLTLEEITAKDIIKNSSPDNFYQVGYDLTIKNIISCGKDNKEQTLEVYDLNPGTTVFISTEEDIELPCDIVGLIIQKNTLIRKGLQIDAPVYQPGHYTKIFLRVTNISADTFSLKQGQKIAAIMFQKLSEPVEKYKGSYENEFKYKGAADYPTDTLPQLLKVEKKIENLHELEDKLINKVITLCSLFIGLFSLINMNVNFIQEHSILNMIIYNLMTIGLLGIFSFFIGTITSKKIEKTLGWILGLSIILIIASCVLAIVF